MFTFRQMETKETSRRLMQHIQTVSKTHFYNKILTSKNFSKPLGDSPLPVYSILILWYPWVFMCWWCRRRLVLFLNWSRVLPVVFNCLWMLYLKESCCAACTHTFPLVTLWLHHTCAQLNLSIYAHLNLLSNWTFQSLLCTLRSSSHAHLSHLGEWAIAVHGMYKSHQV